tara:strand:+ start:1940 stop:2101 length:162 start_codon:yes stop_codon:yes gene_type:complete
VSLGLLISFVINFNSTFPRKIHASYGSSEKQKSERIEVVDKQKKLSKFPYPAV